MLIKLADQYEAVTSLMMPKCLQDHQLRNSSFSRWASPPPPPITQGRAHRTPSIPATEQDCRAQAGGERQKAKSNHLISSTEMSSPRLDVGFAHALEGGHKEVLTV